VFYGPLAMLNLPAALAGWTPILFIEKLPIVWIGPTFAMLLLLFAWLGTLGAQRRAGFPALRGQRRLLLAMVALLLWWAVSLAWAPQPELGAGAMIDYAIAFGVAIIAMTSLTDGRHVRWVMIAFVVGAAMSVLAGFAASGLDPASSAIESATQTEGRLQGGGGDPNYLAAGLVPAIVLAAVLMVHYRNAIIRTALGLGIAIIVAGLAATESRGGALAALAAGITALVVLRNHRQHVLAALAVVGTLAALWFAAFPGAWQRVSAFDGGGNGRSDLWNVALRVAGDHPVRGIGMGNFETQARRYVRRPGQLSYVRLIVDRPHVAHNTYLQILAEQGIVGLVLWLSVAVGFTGAARRAGHLLERTGRPDLAMLARALLIAQVAMMFALIFITDGYDKRLWLLFALGPVLLGIARRGSDRLPA
jgi:O-antigen ligase